jgi:hypothetical protein
LNKCFKAENLDLVDKLAIEALGGNLPFTALKLRRKVTKVTLAKAVLMQNNRPSINSM